MSRPFGQSIEPVSCLEGVRRVSEARMRSNPIPASLRIDVVSISSLQPDAGDAGASGPRIVEVRPHGLADGKFGWPDWGIGLVGGFLLLVGLAFWGLRVYQYRKRG